LPAFDVEGAPFDGVLLRRVHAHTNTRRANAVTFTGAAPGSFPHLGSRSRWTAFFIGVLRHRLWLLRWVQKPLGAVDPPNSPRDCPRGKMQFEPGRTLLCRIDRPISASSPSCEKVLAAQRPGL
jgi:hypothetical protein